MKEFSIARPYAVAAFEYANEQSTLDEWFAALKLIQSFLNQAEIIQLIQHPEVSPEQVNGLLDAVAQGQLNQSQLNFLHLLAENKRLLLIDEIVQLFKLQLAEMEQIIAATITTAESVEQADVDKIKIALENKFKHHIELESEIDPSILGGAIIRSKDWVIDGSVRGKLEQMAKDLIVEG